MALMMALGLTSPLSAQETRFFRVVGPVPARITSISRDGYLTWTNALTNATFTVQTAPGVGAGNSWVDYVHVPVTNATTVHRLLDPNPPPGMAFIPAGLFQMGDVFGELTDNPPVPVHPVYVSACYMDKYEVTKTLWDGVQQWAVTNGYSFNNTGLGKAPNHPINSISWYDMVKWCNARSEKEGLAPCYYTDANQTNIYRNGQLPLANDAVKWTATGHRLPTEAEWEKAARGGLSGKRFPWGDTISHSQANYYSDASRAFDISPTRGLHPLYSTNGIPGTSPVGSFAANGYGLYDMAGNVFDSCWDAYSTYTTNAITDPHGPATRSNFNFSTLRGGGWQDVSLNSSHLPICVTAFRLLATEGIFISNDVGFRCVRNASP